MAPPSQYRLLPRCKITDGCAKWGVGVLCLTIDKRGPKLDMLNYSSTYTRDENGRRKNQLNESEEYAREAKPTERGRVWEGASPLPRQEPQQFDPKNGAFSWILNHESVGGEWLQSHPYSHLGLNILRLFILSINLNLGYSSCSVFN